MATLVRFGRFELDLGAGELRSAGARVHLQDQPFRVLACLIERAGELVTRDELQARLWNDGRFVDFEHGINAAIKRLRVALNDTAENPQFVETVQRRGYRFLAPIDYVEATPRTAASSPAHKAYVKGLYHWSRPSDSGLEEAIGFFEAALAADPTYAAAHSVLARVHVAVAEYYKRPARPALEAARAAAARALQLAPRDANAHVASGDVKRSLEWDWEGAERSYLEALEANPGSEAAHRRYGLLLAARGETKAAAAAAERACDLDPLCLAINANAALVHYLCGDYDRACARCHHTLDMEPAFAPARHVLAASWLQLNRHHDALRLMGAADSRPGDPLSLAWLAYVAAAAGEQRMASQLLEELAALRVDLFMSSFHVARVEAALGRRDAAVAQLSRAVVERDPALFTLPRDPGFSAVRSDPRVVRLIRDLGLRRAPPTMAAAG